jgi:hypothetical protein
VSRSIVTVFAVAAVLVAGVLVIAALDSGHGNSQPATGSGTAGTTQVTTPAPVAAPLNGPNLTAYTRGGYSNPDVERDLVRIARLGSTAVALVPTWYMAAPDSSEIKRDAAKTPSDASLEQAIDWASAQGLKVVLKPHVDVFDESFRGDIQPADREAWFASYERFITHYADLAERAGDAVNTFVVGTELKSMSSDAAPWESVISAVREAFPGQLTYAANWDEVAQVQFFGSLDMIGVDAYYPLAADGEVPTAESLAAAWEPNIAQLQSLSDQWGKPVLVTEVGYPTQPTAASNPFEVASGQGPDEALQALLYQAAFDAFSDKDWVSGILWWSWRADPGPEEDPATDYTPEGKVSEQVIAAAQG